MILTHRPFAGEADLPPIVTLVDACEEVDRLDRRTSVAESRAAFASPAVDTARDLRLWIDEHGRLLAFGRLNIYDADAEVEGRFWLHVHPLVRGGDVEAQIIAWAEERMHAAGRERGRSARLLTAARDDKDARIALLEAHGFRRVRYFFTMARPLDQPLPSPRISAGFIVRALRGQDDAEAAAWVEVSNTSFRDHWNSVDMTVEDLRREMDAPSYRPDLYLVAVAPDGLFAAFCQCVIDEEANRRDGRKEGMVLGLGTRPEYRGLGLGRTLLLSGLRSLRAAGIETAHISVDAENPTGALGLYESAGFRTFETWIMYRKAA